MEGVIGCTRSPDERLEVTTPAMPQAGPSGKQARAARLTRWSGTLGIEKNCAQVIPIGANGSRWRPSGNAPVDQWQRIDVMEHRPVSARGSFLGLSADAFLMMAFLHTLYARQGFDEQGSVQFAPEDVPLYLGLPKRWPEAKLISVLKELEDGEYSGVLFNHDGTRERGNLRCVERCHPAGEMYVVHLSPFVAKNLRNDFTAYLDPAMSVEMHRVDALAFRLWLYAEAQNLRRSLFAAKGFSRCIFRERCTDKNRSLSISRLLSLHLRTKTNAIQRTRKAVDVLNKIDAKYEARVKEGASWCVLLKRGDVGKANRTASRAGEPSTELSADASTELPTNLPTELSTGLPTDCLTGLSTETQSTESQFVSLTTSPLRKGWTDSDETTSETDQGDFENHDYTLAVCG
jgi:hypothetical protein